MVEKFRTFMQGRYGFDKLGLFLIVAGVVFSFLSRLFWFSPFYWVSILLDVIFIYRVLSRKEYARRKENRIFLDLFDKAKNFFQRDRVNYNYYKCPVCKTTFKKPKNNTNNGYSTKVICPKCKNEF